MAWRVSWAALCATLISDRPTINMADAPINKQTKPAIIRLEITTEVAKVFVVMSPSVRPVKANTLILLGRSPDSRVVDFKVPSQFPSG